MFVTTKKRPKFHILKVSTTADTGKKKKKFNQNFEVLKKIKRKKFN